MKQQKNTSNIEEEEQEVPEVTKDSEVTSENKEDEETEEVEKHSMRKDTVNDTYSNIIEAGDIPVYQDFEEMGLSDDILRGVFSYGFEKPSEIQKRAIGCLISGRDLIAQSQSGTGKTGAFTIGTMQRVDPSINKPQILIIEPTRELSLQVCNVYKAIGDYLKIKIHCSIGGTRVNDERQTLSRGVHVVIGTPGRITDMIKRRYLDLTYLKTFVLDEADEMLSRGFLDNIREICEYIPPKTQASIFSATMPAECLEITENFMNNPIKIIVQKEELTLEGILQYYVDTGQNDYKFEVICDLYEALHASQSVIFCSTTKRVDHLFNLMKENNFAVECMHGKMTHEERTTIMEKFRRGEIRFLIATDLVARGIDIQGISLVINYDLPNDIENYIHRIGRAGRFGRKGVAITLVTERDIDDMLKIQTYYNTQINPLPSNINNLI